MPIAVNRFASSQQGLAPVSRPGLQGKTISPLVPKASNPWASTQGPSPPSSAAGCSLAGPSPPSQGITANALLAERSQLLEEPATSSPFKSPFKNVNTRPNGVVAAASPFGTGAGVGSPLDLENPGGGGGNVHGGNVLPDSPVRGDLFNKAAFSEPEPESDRPSNGGMSAPAPWSASTAVENQGAPVAPAGVGGGKLWQQRGLFAADTTDTMTAFGSAATGRGGPNRLGRQGIPDAQARMELPVLASAGLGGSKIHKEKAGKLTIFPMNFSGQPTAKVPAADDRLPFTNAVVKCPCLMLLGMLLLPMAMSVVALIKAPLTLDITAESFEIRDSHFSQQRYKSMLEAMDIEGEFYTMRRQLEWTPPEHRLARIQIVYEPSELNEPAETQTPPEGWKKNEILDFPRLERVREIEQTFRRFEGYETWCKRDAQLFVGCTPPSSLITYIYPRVNPVTCKLSYDGLGDKMVRPLKTALDSLAHVENSQWFFPLGHTDTSSQLLRTQFDFALDHKPSETEVAEFRVWLQRVQKPLLQLSGDGVNVYIGGDVLTEVMVLQELYHDMLMACVSLLLVLIYTAIHCDSLLLAVMAMLMIALSFPVSLFVYYLFFGNAEVGVLNVLSIYIVLGIGVDDCYVFLDGFKQCRMGGSQQSAGSLDPAVFGAAFSRAARAMFVTSVTTALAFLANLISSIPVIYSFAVFMGTIVIVNYIFAITIFVAVVAVWVAYVEPHEKRCASALRAVFPHLSRQSNKPGPMKPTEIQKTSCCGKSKTDDEDGGEEEPRFLGIAEIADPTSIQLDERKQKRASDHTRIVAALRRANLLGPESDGEAEHASLRMTEQFFLCKFGPFVANYRRAILATAAIVVSIGIIMASSLQASDDVPKLFAADNPIQRFIDLQNSNFTSSKCDECAAAYRADFLCHSVDCGAGNRCQYGDCYDTDNIRLTDAGVPCELEPARLSAQCGAAWRDLTDLGTRNFLNAEMRFDLSEDVTQAVLQTWRPDNEFTTVSCKDNYKECFAWADRGECTDNPYFMRSQCRFSCDFCLNQVENYWQCMDNVDNDGDGAEDCDDSDCTGYPLCAASYLSKQIVMQAVCRSEPCMELIDGFVSNCRKSQQRANIKYEFNSMCRGGWLAANLSYMQGVPGPATPSTSCPYVEYEHEWAPTPFSQNTTQTCQCEQRESEFYALFGVLFLTAALAFGFSGFKKGKQVPADEFMQHLHLHTSCNFYLLAIPSLTFWIACLSGGNTKERGFFIVMTSITVLCIGWLIASRNSYAQKFEDAPVPNRQPNHIVFNHFITLNGLLLGCGLSFCIWGCIVNLTDMHADDHIIAECKTEEGIDVQVEAVADMEENGVDSKYYDTSINVDCVPVAECRPGETMALGMLSIPTISFTLMAIAATRIYESRQVAKPDSLTTYVLLPFLVHGLIGLIFWIRCTSSDETQEEAYFIVLLAWSCLVMLYLVGWGWANKFYRDTSNPSYHRMPLMVLCVIDFLGMCLGTIGVQITSTGGEAWFAGCLTNEDMRAGNTGQAEKDATQDAEDQQDQAAEYIEAMHALGPERCIIDAECGALESTIYGAVGLGMLLMVCQGTCLYKCGIANFPKSVNNLNIGLFFLVDVIFLVFWTACKTTDSSVEKGFYVVLAIYCCIAIVILIYNVIRDRNLLDRGFPIMISVFTILLAGCLYAIVITFGNDAPVLATCTPYRPCHWWKIGMPTEVRCADYWNGLKDACSMTRCSGRGQCVGFPDTGGCLCVPSYEGRFCESALEVNHNKAQVSIVLGLVGLVEEDVPETDEIGALYLHQQNELLPGEEAEHVAVWQPAKFQISHPDAQLHVAAMCDELMALADGTLQPQSIECFMQDFRDWISSRSDSLFPVEQSRFLPLLKDWLSTAGGKYFRHVGFHRNTPASPQRPTVSDVAWVRISFYTELSQQSPGFTALPVFNAIENFVADQNARAPPSLIDAPAMQTSSLWIKMFTEVSAINGVIYAILIIALCSFFTIFVFTGHSRMATIVVGTVFGMLSTILGCFKLAGWKLGIVEAISALVLIGSSVDYSLHIAEAFVECSQANRVTAHPFKMGRSALVTQALTRIGVSVLHAATTTFLSVVCLMFCGVVLFVKFGQIIAVSVVVSILFALMPLGSMLGLVGPRAFRRSFKRQVSILCVMMVVLLLVFIAVYSLDKAGHIDVTGPAGEPLFGRKIRVENGALES